MGSPTTPMLNRVRFIRSSKNNLQKHLDILEFAKIGEEKMLSLEREFEEEEVKEAIYVMAGDKAPGPSCFPIAFIQRFWSMLTEDILEFMKEFHSRGKLSKGIGASFIALIIPKTEGEIGIKDFRPISLIGSVYKILARVLAGRLQKVLPEIISQEQGTFVKGRQILDGVLKANECIHSRDKERRPGLTRKLDLEKAYDRVDREFLQYLLYRMGFGATWQNWIKECLSSVHFSIINNGSPKDYFQTQRGLRQCDPLSPFLFVIVAEALSRMVMKAENQKNIPACHLFI
eukprot:TRINITY_DN22188_c0_g1_i1.p1 TRINITY_DN22188_c0_g1~~TRINITY_DN22188_c0_g1_i1.p1  ORF type:complete len:288 (+),score=35.68 TRINITY_DN22188_c0_g1_i1:796-1659(+)